MRYWCVVLAVAVALRCVAALKAQRRTRMVQHTLQFVRGGHAAGPATPIVLASQSRGTTVVFACEAR